jgi:hypothetical protein
MSFREINAVYSQSHTNEDLLKAKAGGMCDDQYAVRQDFSNCGTPATVQWYARVIRKNQTHKL